MAKEKPIEVDGEIKETLPKSKSSEKPTSGIAN